MFRPSTELPPFLILFCSKFRSENLIHTEPNLKDIHLAIKNDNYNFFYFQQTVSTTVINVNKTTLV